jgi:hypothetical protein
MPALYPYTVASAACNYCKLIRTYLVVEQYQYVRYYLRCRRKHTTWDELGGPMIANVGFVVECLITEWPWLQMTHHSIKLQCNDLGCRLFGPTQYITYRPKSLKVTHTQPTHQIKTHSHTPTPQPSPSCFAFSDRPGQSTNR